MRIFVSDLSECVNRVICEKPFVRLLTSPQRIGYEVIVGIEEEIWTALAQVNEALCIVQLTVLKKEGS